MPELLYSNLKNNGSDECVRLKNRVVNATILENTIESCGVHHTQFESEVKHGECIYIGTSSTQVIPTPALMLPCPCVRQ